MSTELLTIPPEHIHYFWSQIHRNRSWRPRAGREPARIGLQRCLEVSEGVRQCFLCLSAALMGFNRVFKGRVARNPSPWHPALLLSVLSATASDGCWKIPGELQKRIFQNFSNFVDLRERFKSLRRPLYRNQSCFRSIGTVCIDQNRPSAPRWPARPRPEPPKAAKIRKNCLGHF